MNSNYEWQKFEANRRGDGFRLQAEANRQAKRNKAEGKQSDSVMGKVSFAFAVGFALFVIGFLLSGCQLGEVPLAEAKSVANNNEMSMVDRIIFQDALESRYTAGNPELVISRPHTPMSMGERISFHDQLWEKSGINNAAPDSASTPKAVTMADRIRFQDRVHQ